MARLPAINIFEKLKKRGEKPHYSVPEKVWQDPLYFIAFGFGSGTIPFAPGTFGTLFAIPFYLLIQPLPLFIYLAFVILFTLFSMWLCGRISRELQVQDHPGMCLDEFAGFFVTMINAPHGWQWVALGFILFRIFDIFKPWPIKTIDEKIHGGIGMVLDDVLAGLYSLFIMQLSALLLHKI